MGSSLPRVARAVLTLLAAAICWVGTLSFASDPTSTEPASGGLYLKVSPAHALKLSKLKPGDRVEGTLSRDVYSVDRKVLAAGSQVRLVVDHTEKRRRAMNDHWPGIVKLFTPRH